MRSSFSSVPPPLSGSRRNVAINRQTLESHFWEIQKHMKPSLARHLRLAAAILSILALISTSGLSAPNPNWIVDTIEINPTLRDRMAVTVDAQNITHVAYINGTTMMYAFWNGNGWTKRVVDTNIQQSGFGGTIGLAINSQGYPILSYRAP